MTATVSVIYPLTEPGFPAAEVCRRTGITFRQLDFWTRSGLTPASCTPHGRAGPCDRRWSVTDIVRLTVMGRLIAFGFTPLAAAGLAVHADPDARCMEYTRWPISLLIQLGDSPYDDGGAA